VKQHRPLEVLTPAAPHTRPSRPEACTNILRSTHLQLLALCISSTHAVYTDTQTNASTHVPSTCSLCPSFARRMSHHASRHVSHHMRHTVKVIGVPGDAHGVFAPTSPESFRSFFARTTPWTHRCPTTIGIASCERSVGCKY
jgi:hypothetical protein